MNKYFVEFFSFNPPSDYAGAAINGVFIVLVIYCFVIFFWFISNLLRRKL